MKRKARPARTIAIIGTGLIGASIGLAARRASQRTRVIGYDRRTASARVARRRGALTSIAPSLERAVAAADIVVLAVPLRAVIALLPRVLKSARDGSVVIDVAGLKVSVLKAAAPLLMGRSRVGFAGGHPFAGLERCGPESASDHLFRRMPFALCVPRQPSRAAVLRQAQSFVRSLGSVPVPMSAREHDRVVAATSGLPQLVASATALAVADLHRLRTQLTGPGFESVTRLARSPAALWTGSLLENRRNVVPALSAFETRLRNFRQAIERYNAVDLARLLRSAAAAQRRLKSR
ncbi:MAG: prephenate dehydrogenase/arogenate dehydrogenase family protein [Candidatus Eremiobacteraeota bacterium]|nr:prephenate dehydrogenase/arogenate dehydrogenase family protein [Candidatus Eremiobacteraeota bacterium]